MASDFEKFCGPFHQSMGGPDEKETEMICAISESMHVFMQYF